MRERRLLLNRDFQLLWIGETLSDIGSQSAAIAYPLLVLALSGSPTQAGVVGLAKWLPVALFSLPAGVLADRFNRKHLMIFCDVVRLLGALSIVLALALGRPTFLQILAVSFVEGGLFATAHIAERGALAQVVEREQLQDAVARNEGRAYAAALIGPSLGGLLFSIARAVPFIADAASYLCSTAAVAATRTDFQVRSVQPRRPWSEVRGELLEGLHWYREQPFYRTTSILFAAGNPMFVACYLLILLLARQHHATPAEIGVMFTISSAGGLIGALLVGPLTRRFSSRALLIGGPWLAVAVLLLLLVVHNALLMGVIAACAEFLAPAVNAVVAGSRIAVAPDELQGRIQAIATTSSMSLTWFGPLAVGFLFDRIGSSSTTLAVAAWGLGLALAATAAPSIRHHLPGVAPIPAQDL
ncbi:MAG TPA: MFS transporter [Solirubrobacteraceae bacterium]|jgi:MFS family permease|nr:MFS transporter [Solirubrobacteraceae bacterium]